MATRRLKKGKPQHPTVVEKKKAEPKKVIKVLQEVSGETVPDHEVWSYERQWKKKKEIPPEIPDEAA